MNPESMQHLMVVIALIAVMVKAAFGLFDYRDTVRANRARADYRAEALRLYAAQLLANARRRHAGEGIEA